MRLTIHIGTEKTGTTTIQRFLYLNRAALAERGILVPVSPGKVNQRKLPVIAYNANRADEFIRQEQLMNPADRSAAVARWWEEFCKEVGQFTGDRVLVSSEHFQSRLRTPEEVVRLRDLLRSMFDDIDVVLYLREPMKCAVSLFSTAVRSGADMREVPQPDNEYFHNIMNHRQTIETWSSIFGANKLRIRLFEKSCFYKGNLLHDFVQVAGMPELDYDFPPPQNESLSDLGISILSRINKRGQARVKNGQADPRYARISSVVCTVFTNGAAHVPDPETVRAYREAFAASNEWVRQNFFPAREQLFSEADYGKMPQPAQLPEDELQRLCNLVERLAGVPAA